MLKALMLPAEVKLLKPNPEGCWHCVPAMMHGLAVLCGPSTLSKKGVPAPGISVSATAEAAPVRAKVTAVVPIPIHAKRDFPIMTHSLDRIVIITLPKSRAGQSLIFGRL